MCFRAAAGVLVLQVKKGVWRARATASARALDRATNSAFADAAGHCTCARQIYNVEPETTITWRPQFLMFINILEIRRNDRVSAAQLIFN